MQPNHPDPLERSFNLAALRGILATEVRVSELPAGGVVHNFEVKAGIPGHRHVVPVAWHDPVRPARLEPGDEVVVIGVVRRRWFRAGGGSQSRTELLASCVAKPTSARARRALAVAADALRDDEGSNG